MKSLSLRAKLYGAFGIIAVFILFMAIMASFFITSMGDITRELSDHPYTVTNAIKDIEIAGFEEFTALENAINLEDTTTEHFESLHESHNEALDDIDIIHERYLGDMKDVDNVESSYLNVYNKVVEGLNLVEDGRLAEAKIVNHELQTIYLPKLISDHEVIKAFAENKAIEYQNQSDEVRQQYAMFVGIISVTVIILELVVAVAIISDISPTMKEIITKIKNTKDGKEYVPINSVRGDEFGTISNNLDQMFHNLKTQKEIEELNYKLRNLQDRENLRITLMSIGDGVITTDINGSITNINPIASRLTGYDPIEAMGKNANDVFNIINKNTRKPAINPIDKVLEEGRTFGLANHTVLISKQGEEHDISDSAAPILGEDGELHGVVLVFRDVTEEYKQKQQIEYLSLHDSLTGLYNRNYLEQRFSELTKDYKGNVAVLMGDVNGLKITNDAFGHDFGDKLLKGIATILQKSLKDYQADIVRWGGDEFVIVVEDVKAKEVEQIISNIDLNSKTAKLDTPVQPNISFGFSIWKNSFDSIYRSLIQAEDMMYENKLLQKDSLRSAIVHSLESSLYEKSYETEEHANRVADYSLLLCNKLNLSSTITNGVVLLSKLHDIGKISIDDGILLKKGKLDRDEWKEIKKHPETGFRIATGLHELAHIAEGILCHHEHYDGNGYPRGLKGKDIPLDARIVAIADAYDVMTSNRAYKKAITKDKAIMELTACKGSQFDPYLVDLFIEELK